jgi:uncharacterized protein
VLPRDPGNRLYCLVYSEFSGVKQPLATGGDCGQGVAQWYWEHFMTIDDKTRIELEAAVFRRVVDHLRSRTDVQNIDMMDLTGFCRNCLASWMMAEADSMGLAMTRDACREAVYGMPYSQWKAKYQTDLTAEQTAMLEKRALKH